MEQATLSEEIEYTKNLISCVEKPILQTTNKQLKNKLESLKNIANNKELSELQSASDEDAKLGYKSEDNSFFGYKNHIAMTEERIITAVEITSGEAPDGKYLKDLIEQSKKNGIEVKEVLGDTAYSGKENLDYGVKNNISIISKLNPVISNVDSKENSEFEYIKDADTMRCKAGHLAKRKEIEKAKENKNERKIYYFDVKKCVECPHREGCYKPNSKQKRHSVSIMSDVHKKQKEFQETDYFKERSSNRYMIEAKNSEIKTQHGLDKCKYFKLTGMKIQSFLTAFVVNAKRILLLLKASETSRLEVCPN